MTVNQSAEIDEVTQSDRSSNLVMHDLDMQEGLDTLNSNQQVVLMTDGNQQVVITSEAQLGDGVLHVQGDNQTYILHTTKTEPEDLSFSIDREGEGLRQSIDLEAGAQAIQASAATAVQNVLRSLKESDKSILNHFFQTKIS